MILPDLAKKVAWWQERMRPSDPNFGNGIADWTITAEYVDQLSLPGVGRIWGCMCSPSRLPTVEGLTPEDVAAKRAHIMISMPTNAAEIAEVDETVAHELYHVLAVDMGSENVEAEENAAHSLAPLLAELERNDPSRARVLARAISQHPTKARAYRAGGTMPENEEDKKAPKAQEGAPDAAAIVEAVAANDGNAALEILKKILASAAGDIVAPESAPEIAPAPPEVPTMGMKPEDAYARQMAAERKEAIEAIVDANPHLSDKQKACVRAAGTIAMARQIAGSYERPTAPEKPADKTTMGLQAHPATAAGGGKPETIRARALKADPEVLARVQRATSSEDTLGLNLDTPGHSIVWSPSEMLKEQRHRWIEEQKGRAS